MTDRVPGDHRPPGRDRPSAGGEDPGEETTERDDAGVTDEVGDRAMAGDLAAQRQVDEAWDATEPMSGEAPTG